MFLRSLITHTDLTPNKPDLNIHIVNGQTSTEVVVLHQANNFVIVPADLIDRLATLMHEVYDEATGQEGVVAVQEVQ